MTDNPHLTSQRLPDDADAVSLLQNLGFKPNVANLAVARAIEELGEGAKLDALIRVGLKRAAG